MNIFYFNHFKITHFNFKLVQTSIFPQQCEAIKVDYSLTPTTKTEQQGERIIEISLSKCLTNLFQQVCKTVPVLRHATLTSHHSGTRGKMRNTRSPLSKLHTWCRTFASFLEWKPNSSKLHLTSSPLSFTHHRAGRDLCPFCNIQKYTNNTSNYLTSAGIVKPFLFY